MTLSTIYRFDILGQKEDGVHVQQEFEEIERKELDEKVKRLTDERDKYEYFWGNRSVFSQWYPCKFEIDGKTYNCAEQYRMHQKAGMRFLKCLYLYIKYFYLNSLFLYTVKLV